MAIHQRIMDQEMTQDADKERDATAAAEFVVPQISSGYVHITPLMFGEGAGSVVVAQLVDGKFLVDIGVPVGSGGIGIAPRSKE